MSGSVLEIEGLKTYFHTDEGVVKAVDDISLSIQEGQTLGVVGESGSGKSVTSLTIMRLLPDRAAQIAGGTVTLLGRDLLSISSQEMPSIRGSEIAMIFQEPMTSLNPVYRVGDQVAEAIIHHEGLKRREALQRTIELFEEVGIPDPHKRIRSYPHEMSGGQKQRVMIAMALSCNPKLLIADEPTTALDVTIQAQILDLMRRLRDERRMSILFITHDLGVIAEIADQVAVMFRGKLVEYGSVEKIFSKPTHPYTKGLLACRPRLDSPFRILPTVDDYLKTWVEDGEVKMRERQMSPEREQELLGGGRPKMPEGEGDPILEVTDLKVHFPLKRTFLGKVTDWVHAVDGISFKVYPGQTLGLVGESGCGKTTTGRAILRLIEPTSGTIIFRNRVRGGPIGAGAISSGRERLDIRALTPAQLKPVRRNLQIIFQDPYSSLNPRLTVEQAITEPMLVHGIGDGEDERRDRAAKLLEEVGLDPIYLRRYPHEFSGGQRQRICIARTLAVEPEFIVCDESVSALDVSVQAQVLNLLKELQLSRELTYIFISHDLSVVKFMSDVMCVMKEGLIVEQGPSEAIYAAPAEEYTRKLIEAIPRDDLDHIRARQAARIAP
ncbi:MAG TPA: ABC transporter ATP-binding protein [Deltaproteobacteria bacterium]|nr:ABC transporter ATP-binding protein [Deltaproteobacteria bacterium]